MINIFATALAAVGEISKEGIVPKCDPATTCGWDELLKLGEKVKLGLRNQILKFWKLWITVKTEF